MGRGVVSRDIACGWCIYVVLLGYWWNKQDKIFAEGEGYYVSREARVFARILRAEAWQLCVCTVIL